MQRGFEPTDGQTTWELLSHGSTRFSSAVGDQIWDKPIRVLELVVCMTHLQQQ